MLSKFVFIDGELSLLFMLGIFFGLT